MANKYLTVLLKKNVNQNSLLLKLSSFVQIQMNQTLTECPLVCSRQSHMYLHLLYVYSQHFYPLNLW